MQGSLIFNSLGPSDTIWRQRSGSTLVQVMACCLTAPSHYLNQCWLIISESSDIHIRAISQEMLQPSITEICLKITYLKFHLNFPGANELILNVRSSTNRLCCRSVDRVVTWKLHSCLDVDASWWLARKSLPPFHIMNHCNISSVENWQKTKIYLSCFLK